MPIPRSAAVMVAVAAIVIACVMTLLLPAPVAALVTAGLGAIAIVILSGGRPAVREPAVADASPSAEDRLDRLLDTLPVAAFRKDSQGRFQYVNRAFEQLTGYSSAALMGRTSAHLLAESSTDATFPDKRDTRGATGRQMRSAQCLNTAHGTELYVMTHEAPLAASAGAGDTVAGCMVDVTPLKQSNNELRQERNRQELVLASGQQGVFDIPMELGGETFISPRCWELMGYDLQNPLPDLTQFRELVHAADHGRLRDDLVETLKGKREYLDSEVRLTTRGGGYLWVRLRGVPIRNDQGRATRMVGSVIDIDARKRLELALREAKDDAIAASRAKETFFSTMSHEIRTPLNGVIGAASLLSSTALTAEQQRFVATIGDSGEALLSLIDDILDFSKIESSKLDLEDKPFDVLGMVEQTLAIVGERARIKGIDLVSQVAPDVPQFVRGDMARIRQILLNLLSNAVKFTEAGYVSVSVSRADTAPPSLEFCVRDTGIGIAPAALSRLFQPFSQADSTTTRRFGGTGLGLAISRRLAEIMNGSITVTSEVGKGSTFSLLLPLAATRLAAGQMAAGTARFDRLRAVVCDPSEAQRTALAQSLASWGFDVEIAPDNSTLANILERGTPAALVFEPLPLSELEVIDLTLLRSAKQRGTALVAVSRKPEVELTELFAAQGLTLDAILLKPVRQSHLFNALAQLLLQNSSQRNPMARGDTMPLGIHTGRTVLLVEDNNVNQLIASEMLKRLGYGVTTVADGQAAVDAVLGGTFDAVLMDLEMPVMGGLDAVAAIRDAMPPERIPPIIALTAHAQGADRDRCLAAGMDDYLSKPLQLDVLAAALQQACGARSAGAQPTRRRAA